MHLGSVWGSQYILAEKAWQQQHEVASYIAFSQGADCTLPFSVLFSPGTIAHKIGPIFRWLLPQPEACFHGDSKSPAS